MGDIFIYSCSTLFTYFQIIFFTVTWIYDKSLNGHAFIDAGYATDPMRSVCPSLPALGVEVTAG